MSLEVSKLHKHWKHVCVNLQLCVLPETVRKEAATVAAVFPSPDAVMAILVQRVLEQRVVAVLDKLLPKPSLTSPPPMEEGGYQQYLRTLAGAYEKTQELAKELHGLGCGDLDVEGKLPQII
jgi:hypothetical protein